MDRQWRSPSRHFPDGPRSKLRGIAAPLPPCIPGTGARSIRARTLPCGGLGRPRRGAQAGRAGARGSGSPSRAACVAQQFPVRCSWPRIAAIRRRRGSGTSLKIERGTFIRGDKPSAVFGSVCAGPRVVISSRPEAIRSDGAPSRRAANGSMRRTDLEPARRSAPLPAQLRSRVASQYLVHIQERGVDPPARAARAFRSAIAAPGTPSARAAGERRSGCRERGFIGPSTIRRRGRRMPAIGRRSASPSSCSCSRPSFGCSTPEGARA
jgi:hypothetical protein